MAGKRAACVLACLLPLACALNNGLGQTPPMGVSSGSAALADDDAPGHARAAAAHCPVCLRACALCSSTPGTTMAATVSVLTGDTQQHRPHRSHAHDRLPRPTRLH
jgi:hypothetical protein